MVPATIQERGVASHARAREAEIAASDPAVPRRGWKKGEEREVKIGGGGGSLLLESVQKEVSERFFLLLSARFFYPSNYIFHWS